MMENNEDIELMLFKLKEGLLSDEEAREATLFLQQHPEWQEKADLYDPLLKAPSYPAATFADKDSLRKPLTAATTQRKTIVLRRLSIAASILIAVTIAACILFIPNAKEGRSIIVAENRQNKVSNIFSQDASPNDVSNDATRATTDKRRRPLQAATPAIQATVAQQEQHAVPAEQTASEPVPTVKVTITDKLIAYLDDAEPGEPDAPPINMTDKLIAYLQTDTPAPAESAPRPKWTYAIEDLWIGVQLAYTERQNEIIDIFTNKN